ncbi:MAG TPA: hypothetical protein VJ044_19070, partial [Candidatus Hodarchaeales archaeon]|nr:hypothetical protein [Candidatus Hodarchaeales archaeon]
MEVAKSLPHLGVAEGGNKALESCLSATIKELAILESGSEQAKRFDLAVVEFPKYLSNVLESYDLFPDGILTGKVSIRQDSLTRFFSSVKNQLKDDTFLTVSIIGNGKFCVKVILDSLFGIKTFLNEIYVPGIQMTREEAPPPPGSILVYYFGKSPRINPSFKNKISGGYWHTLHSKGQGPPKNFTIDGISHTIAPPIGNHWKFKQETIDHMCDNGRIRLNSANKPLYWVKEKNGHIVDTLW